MRRLVDTCGLPSADRLLEREVRFDVRKYVHCGD